MSQFFASGGQSIGVYSFSISPSNAYSGLISFRIDSFDVLAVQMTRMSILQHHTSKTSILWCSGFFIVQLFHPYMTTGKSIALIIWTFVGKVMSLVFNILSRLVITFLPRSKRLLNHGCNHHLQWFWSPPKERQPLFPHLFPMKWWDQMPWSLFSECWVLTQLFPLSSFTFIKRLFSFFSLSV